MNAVRSHTASHLAEAPGEPSKPKVFSLKEESAARSRDGTKGGSRKGLQQSRAAAPTNSPGDVGRLARFTHRLFRELPSQPPQQPMRSNLARFFGLPVIYQTQQRIDDPPGSARGPVVEEPRGLPSGHFPAAGSSGSGSSGVSSFMNPHAPGHHLQATHSDVPSVGSFGSSSSMDHPGTNFFQQAVLTHALSNSSGSVAAPVHPQEGPDSEGSSWARRIRGFSESSSVASQPQGRMDDVVVMPHTPPVPPDPHSGGTPPHVPVAMAPPVPPRLAQGRVDLPPPLPPRAPIGASLAGVVPAGVVPVMRHPQGTGYLPAQIPAGTLLSYQVDPSRGLEIFAHTGASPWGTRPLGMPANGSPGHLLGAHAGPVQQVASPQNVGSETTIVRL